MILEVVEILLENLGKEKVNFSFFPLFALFAAFGRVGEGRGQFLLEKEACPCSA